nr:hypothetical protein [Tanacetum cinerariifolium]
MNNLIYVQANAHLMERDKKRKVRNREILIGEDAREAQEWIVDGDDAHWEAVGDALGQLGVKDELRPRTSARRKERELFEDDFVSGSEGEVDEERLVLEVEDDDVSEGPLSEGMDSQGLGMKDSSKDNSQHKKTKSRVGWKNISVVKTLIETCIHAIALDGREGVSLKVLSLKKVTKALKDNHNFEADQKQMRNHFDYMKLKYEAWLFLKNKTGNIYDDSTNTFNLTEQEWELEIVNVKPLMTTVLYFLELCAQLFDGTMATGIKGGGPSSHEPVYVGEPHMIEYADATKVPNTESSKSTSKAPCVVKNKRRRRQPTDGVDEDILGVLEVTAEKIVESEPPRKLEPPTLEDCQEVTAEKIVESEPPRKLEPPNLEDCQGFISVSCAFVLRNWQGVRTRGCAWFTYKTRRPFVLTFLVEKGFERAILAEVCAALIEAAVSPTVPSRSHYQLCFNEPSTWCPRHKSATRKLYIGNMPKECIKFPTLAKVKCMLHMLRTCETTPSISGHLFQDLEAQQSKLVKCKLHMLRTCGTTPSISGHLEAQHFKLRKHRSFLIGLENLRNGDWRGISKNYIPSRTSTPVASHAQKYFIRMHAKQEKGKRRSSIFDMPSNESIVYLYVELAMMNYELIRLCPSTVAAAAVYAARSSETSAGMCKDDDCVSLIGKRSDALDAVASLQNSVMFASNAMEAIKTLAVINT